jgi:hypothetical protein
MYLEKDPAPAWLGKGRKRTGARVRRLSSSKLEWCARAVNTECALGYFGFRTLFGWNRQSTDQSSNRAGFLRVERQKQGSYASNDRIGVTASRTEVKEDVISDILRVSCVLTVFQAAISSGVGCLPSLRHLAIFRVAGMTNANKTCSCLARSHVRPIISRHLRSMVVANYTSFFRAGFESAVLLPGIRAIQWFHHFVNSSLP